MQLSDKPDAIPQTAASEVGSGDNEPSQCSAARGHYYGVFIIQLAVAFVVESLNSFRGAARNFSLLGQYFPLACLSYSSIRGLGVKSGSVRTATPSGKSPRLVIHHRYTPRGQELRFLKF